MWEELLSVISDRHYPLESMQENVAGYVDLKTGWDLSLINPWFTERGYEFVGYLGLFSENEPSGVYVNVGGYVWCCHTNAADNSLWWYSDYVTGCGTTTLDDFKYLHGYVHQFIWDNDTKTCEVINMAE
jgi:hypothetical protein